MTSNELQKFAVDDIELECAAQGEGEPVLLIHGGVFADWFVPVAAEAALAEFRVIRVRRAGYTPGQAPGHRVSIDEHGRLCAGLLDHLGVERAHVVGHSSGALVAMALATHRPDLVGGLLLVEPARAGDSWPAADEARQLFEPLTAAALAGELRTAFDTFMSLVCASDYRAVLDASLGPDGLPHWEHESAFFFTNEVPAIFDWPFDSSAAARIPQPVLLVGGGSSPSPVHDAMADLATWFPTATVETIAGSDHMLPLRHPAILASTIASFARRSVR